VSLAFHSDCFLSILNYFVCKVVHLSSIPPVLRWLQYFSILRYCLEALAVNEINSGLMIQDTLEGVPVNLSAVVIMKLVRRYFFERPTYPTSTGNSHASYSYLALTYTVTTVMP
jgi:ABC-type multidrug transport system permease subunit